MTSLFASILIRGDHENPSNDVFFQCRILAGQALNTRSQGQHCGEKSGCVHPATASQLGIFRDPRKKPGRTSSLAEKDCIRGNGNRRQ